MGRKPIRVPKHTPNTDCKNAITAELWERRLAITVMHHIGWEGLDQDFANQLTSRLIERTLYQSGYGIFFMWEGKLMFLPAAVSNDLNVFWEPTEFWPIGNHLPFEIKNTKENCVLCRNNSFGMPSVDICRYYANKIAEIQRAMDVNLFQSKIQFAFETSSENEFSVKNMINNVDKNEVAILANRSIMNSVNLINTGFQYYIDKYTAYKADMINEFLQVFGFKNIDIQKSERLTYAEATSKDEFTYDGFFGDMLEMRQEAADNVNKMFGMHIKPVIRNENSMEIAKKLAELDNPKPAQPFGNGGDNDVR